MISNIIHTSFLVIFTLCFCANADVHHAISHIEPLIDTQKNFIDNLDKYITRENIRINTLKKYLNRFKIEDEKAVRDIQYYLGNPINCFTLIKRLTHDLQLMEMKIKDKTVYRKNKTMQYPVRDNLVGAAHALRRLQKTYHLNITQLANGILKGNFSQNNDDYMEIVTPLSASDCYELGRALFEEKHFKDGISWMVVALNKYNVEDADPFTETDIMEHISYAYYALDDYKNGLQWTNNNLMVLDPEDPRYTRAKGAQVHYTQQLEEEANARKKQKKNKNYIDKEMKLELKELSNNDYTDEMYKVLCRGEMDLPSRVGKRLKCRYLTENHPILRLAPIKMEQLYINPDIFMMHEVLRNYEIQSIMNISKLKLEKATDHDANTNQINPSICKLAWLRNNESEVIVRVSRRVSDFTGLSMETAADLQVANYGIGGYHEPHYDFSETKAKTLAHGNRIATVLFYMSEVAQGGATVFPELGLSVFPVRGAALFWRNLHPSGEGDLATLHAGCPVLRGSKWIANNWLHQQGQELLRPCNLEYQKKGILHNIPRPIPKEKLI